MRNRFNRRAIELNGEDSKSWAPAPLEDINRRRNINSALVAMTRPAPASRKWRWIYAAAVVLALAALGITAMRWRAWQATLPAITNGHATALSGVVHPGDRLSTEGSLAIHADTEIRVPRVAVLSFAAGSLVSSAQRGLRWSISHGSVTVAPERARQGAPLILETPEAEVKTVDGKVKVSRAYGLPGTQVTVVEGNAEITDWTARENVVIAEGQTRSFGTETTRMATADTATPEKLASIPEQSAPDAANSLAVVKEIRDQLHAGQVNVARRMFHDATRGGALTPELTKLEAEILAAETKRAQAAGPGAGNL
jgi:hypothetical protein